MTCPKGVPTPNWTGSKDLNFDSNLYLMAASLDPEHGYRWFQRHPGTTAEKEALKNIIFGR
jgi:hypothetical protein